MALALTLRSFTSTLLPVRTIGTFSQTRTRSPARFGQKKLVASNLTGFEKLTMPVRHVLICYARCDVEHDNTALAIDIIAIS